MPRSTSSFQLILGAIVVGASVGVSTVMFVISHKPHLGGVSIEPAVATFVEQVPEYQKVAVPLVVRNTSRSEVTILSAKGSCGCMNVLTSGGKEFAGKYTLKPGSTIPLQVNVSTGGRGGPQVFTTWLTYSAGGKEHIRSSKIHMNVRVGLVLAPRSIVFEGVGRGDSRTTDVLACDSHPDPGLRVKSIANPMEHLLDASIVSPDESTLDTNYLAEGFRPRDVIRVRLKVPENAELPEEIITALVITPSDEMRPKLELPIIIRTAE